MKSAQLHTIEVPWQESSAAADVSDREVDALFRGAEHQKKVVMAYLDVLVKAFEANPRNDGREWTSEIHTLRLVQKGVEKLPLIHVAIAREERQVNRKT